MPKKTPQDLPLSHFVWLSPILEGLPSPIGYDIAIEAKPSAWHVGKDISTEAMLTKCLTSGSDADGQSTFHAIIGRLKVVFHGSIWRVSRSHVAEDGWGPLLYDIAMELATEANAGLCSSESDVSDDAVKVWDYYLTRRDDVTHEMLAKHLRPKKNHKSLRRVYYKCPASTIAELRALEMWKDYRNSPE